MGNASRDQNRIPVLIGVSSSDGVTPTTVYVDPTTHRLYVNASITAAQLASHLQTDTFTSTNLQTTFVPSQTLVYDLGIYINGSLQTLSTNYSVVGGSYVLNDGIPSGCDVIIRYIF